MKLMKYNIKSVLLNKPKTMFFYNFNSKININKSKIIIMSS